MKFRRREYNASACLCITDKQCAFSPDELKYSSNLTFHETSPISLIFSFSGEEQMPKKYATEEERIAARREKDRARKAKKRELGEEKLKEMTGAARALRAEQEGKEVKKTGRPPLSLEEKERREKERIAKRTAMFADIARREREGLPITEKEKELIEKKRESARPDYIPKNPKMKPGPKPSNTEVSSAVLAAGGGSVLVPILAAQEEAPKKEAPKEEAPKDEKPDAAEVHKRLAELFIQNYREGLEKKVDSFEKERLFNRVYEEINRLQSLIARRRLAKGLPTFYPAKSGAVRAVAKGKESLDSLIRKMHGE